MVANIVLSYWLLRFSMVIGGDGAKPYDAEWGRYINQQIETFYQSMREPLQYPRILYPFFSRLDSRMT